MGFNWELGSTVNELLLRYEGSTYLMELSTLGLGILDKTLDEVS